MNLALNNSWQEYLAGEFEKPYFQELKSFLDQEYKNHVIYPARNDIFKAFDICSFEETKVVILGQDPYHGQDQAHGLSFSVNNGVPFPPSLKNIFKELKSDLDIEIPLNGNLEPWAQQGVLLLNATLTVRSKSPGSHQKKGWEEFTDAVIKTLTEKRQNRVFILWGAYAQQKGSIIDRDKHCVIESPHPSPFSAHKGFFGSRPFSKANEYLRIKGLKEISWVL